MVPKFYATTDRRLWPIASMSLLATLKSLKRKNKVVISKDNLQEKEKVWKYVMPSS